MKNTPTKSVQETLTDEQAEIYQDFLEYEEADPELALLVAQY